MVEKVTVLPSMLIRPAHAGSPAAVCNDTMQPEAPLHAIISLPSQLSEVSVYT